MCGLVGLVTKNQTGFNRPQQDAFTTLLFLNILRGEDSTGVMTIDGNGDTLVAKEVGHAYKFINTTEYDAQMNRAWNRGMAMFGHGRKATVGKISDETAHPFNVDNRILLMHNGTMRSDHKRFADVDVDSHAIAHLIASKPLEEALGAFWGAYALIWYDVVERQINMIRNEERPLYWMETECAWLWSSEKEMLEFALKRTPALKLKQGPTSLPPDTLQTFRMDGRQWIVANRKITIKREATAVATSSNHQRYDEEWAEALAAQYGAMDGTWSGSGGSAMRPPFRQQQQQTSTGGTTSPKGGNGSDTILQLLPPPTGGNNGKPPHIETKRVPATGVSNNVGSLVEPAKEPVEFAGCEGMERELAETLSSVSTPTTPTSTSKRSTIDVPTVLTVATGFICMLLLLTMSM
jgi:hypothetical protein